MKLVLKYNEDIKLFSKPIDYDSIVAFVVEEYSIDPATLELSFLDEDNDNITLLSNEDVEVMQAVFDGKEYVKINVQGLIKEVKEVDVKVKEVQLEEKVQEKVEVKIEEKVEEKIVEIVVIEDEKEVEVINKSEKPMIVEGVKEVEEISKEEWKAHCHGRKFQKMEAFLKETVANLVDQRIKILLPCLKEQILNQQKNKPEPVGLIHEGFQCKGCLKNPILGVRYECPECPQFNLCETCEAKIDHDHNLLKIKKLVEKKQEKGKIGHCFKKWFGHHGRGSSSSRDKCHKGGQHWFMRKCWGLSMMFGGKPEDYKEFVSQSEDLRPRETFKKWANIHNIPEEEFKQRFIDMRCQKLSSAFGKPAQEYKKFVEENYEAKYRELVELLKKKGEKMEERKCWWGGKRFNFNESESQEKRCPFKREKESEVKPEKVEQIKKEEPKIEAPKVEDSKVQEEVVIVKKDSAEVTQQKGAIFIQMKQIFGDQHAKEYFKFIEAHFSQGPEAIIQGWMDNASKLKK